MKWILVSFIQLGVAPNMQLSFILFAICWRNARLNVIVEVHPRIHLLNVNEIKKPIATKIFLPMWYSHRNKRPELILYIFSSHYRFLNLIFRCYTHIFECITYGGGTRVFSCLPFIQVMFMLNIQSMYSVITSYIGKMRFRLFYLWWTKKKKKTIILTSILLIRK